MAVIASGTVEVTQALNGVPTQFCVSQKQHSKVQISKQELRNQLTPIQYHVTQECGTEKPYTGEHYRNRENGIYCCVVCGELLFSSKAKYYSGTGWPSFADVVSPSKVNLKADGIGCGCGGPLVLLPSKDSSALRMEVSCANCGAHLGHVFDDGPKPTGKRYCINSAALRFHKITEKGNHKETDV